MIISESSNSYLFPSEILIGDKLHQENIRSTRTKKNFRYRFRQIENFGCD